MQSSTGKYFIGLDHIRALAAFLVFSWHFIHVGGGHHAGPPVFPLSLIAEGHTGVSLFMVLSGYLFAKLLDGKQILYRQFLWNRILRLAPLLLVVLFISGTKKYLGGRDMSLFYSDLSNGLLLPTLPNGGWSITTEFHFYLILPLLLIGTRWWRHSLLLVLAANIGLRVFLYREYQQIQDLSYWTIVGRLDQFLLGILGFQYGKGFRVPHVVAALTAFLFASFYWNFDRLGGYYKLQSYPSPHSIWIWLPTVEGVAYAIMIQWYDRSVEHSQGVVSRLVARVGQYSYSIYLLHSFVVGELSKGVDRYIVDLSNIHVALFFAALCFPVMLPIGYLGYRWIETPFLRFRTRYIQELKVVGVESDQHDDGRAVEGESDSRGNPRRVFVEPQRKAA